MTSGRASRRRCRLVAATARRRCYLGIAVRCDAGRAARGSAWRLRSSWRRVCRTSAYRVRSRPGVHGRTVSCDRKPLARPGQPMQQASIEDREDRKRQGARLIGGRPRPSLTVVSRRSCAMRMSRHRWPVIDLASGWWRRCERSAGKPAAFPFRRARHQADASDDPLPSLKTALRAVSDYAQEYTPYRRHGRIPKSANRADLGARPTRP